MDKIETNELRIKTISKLFEEINRLKNRIDVLEKQKGLTSSIVLEKIWDNEDDAEWDEI